MDVDNERKEFYNHKDSQERHFHIDLGVTLYLILHCIKTRINTEYGCLFILEGHMLKQQETTVLLDPKDNQS